MIDAWVFWTLLAATMQSVRFAAQKYLTDDISPFAATMVRYLFGLPFALVWLLWWLPSTKLPDFNTTFIVCCVLAGIFQVVATVLVMHIFTLRAFAVGSTLIRSEIVITALIGFTFFSESITPLGWLAIVVCGAGVMLIGAAKSGVGGGAWWSLLVSRATVYGLVAALCFSLTSLLIRKASLSFGLNEPIFTAALTLFVMVCWQTVICVGWLLLREPAQMRQVFVRWRPGLFVGLTSVVGSVGWFTAFTLEFASYVKTLGQIEFLFTLLISLYFFKEVPRPLEMIGMVLILLGVIALLLS